MMNRAYFVLMTLAVFVLLLSPRSFAQEQETAEVWDYTFGKIARISKDTITILEFDFDKEKEIETTYDIIDATEFINLNGLSELRIGDEIDIDFREEEDKRVAMAIFKDDKEEFFEGLNVEEQLQET